MLTLTREANGRMIVVSLGRGEMLLEGIERAIRENGVRDAVAVSCIGTLSSMTWHRVMTLDMKPEVEYPVVHGPLELCAVQGLVVNGAPHFHLVCSDKNGVYAGHLEPGCEVLYLAEIALMELTGKPLRKAIDENGLSQLTPDDE